MDVPGRVSAADLYSCAMDHRRPIGFWLKLVDGLIEDQLDATLEEHGVTRRQWQILNLLADQSAAIGELEASLPPFLGQQGEETLAEHLEELSDSNWLSQEAGQYSLTALGHSSLAMLGEVVGQNHNQVSEGISAEDYGTANNVLERMARNLGWSEPT